MKPDSSWATTSILWWKWSLEVSSTTHGSRWETTLSSMRWAEQGTLDKCTCQKLSIPVDRQEYVLTGVHGLGGRKSVFQPSPNSLFLRSSSRISMRFLQSSLMRWSQSRWGTLHDRSIFLSHLNTGKHFSPQLTSLEPGSLYIVFLIPRQHHHHFFSPLSGQIPLSFIQQRSFCKLPYRCWTLQW